MSGAHCILKNTKPKKTMIEAVVVILFLTLINGRFDEYFKLTTLWIRQKRSTTKKI